MQDARVLNARVPVGDVELIDAFKDEFLSALNDSERESLSLKAISRTDVVVAALRHFIDCADSSAQSRYLAEHRSRKWKRGARS